MRNFTHQTGLDTIKKMLQGDAKEILLMQRLISLYLSHSNISELLKIDVAFVSHRVTM